MYNQRQNSEQPASSTWTLSLFYYWFYFSKAQSSSTKLLVK